MLHPVGRTFQPGIACGAAHPVIDVHLIIEEEDDELLFVAWQRHPVGHLLHRQLQRALLAGGDGRQAAQPKQGRKVSSRQAAPSAATKILCRLCKRPAAGPMEPPPDKRVCVKSTDGG